MMPIRPLWFLLAVSVLAGCGETPQLEKGQPVPGFSLQQLSGKSLAFPDELRGKVVAVRFWADWCPFCETEMQGIEPVYRKYREQGLSVLAVNVRQDPDTAQAFIDKLDISYDVLLDEEGGVARSYGVIGLPTTFFVDREGRLGARILGESTPEVFEGVVKELL
ncbi:MAG: TlpA disulfide reductase family protein [Pseudomonadota bacterium]|nr:TlpA disulfide reductase family protein [Pseudomonadota bacterium]